MTGARKPWSIRRQLSRRVLALALSAAGTAVDQPSDPVAATTTVESRSQRRQHRREELRAAAGTTVTQQVGDIGHGPRAGDESGDVRDKLTRRYGG